jgi:hypothetical protein
MATPPSAMMDMENLFLGEGGSSNPSNTLMPAMGENQYTTFPTMATPQASSTTPPGIVPPASSPSLPGAVNTYPNAPSTPVGTESWLGSSNYTLPTNDPSLTAQFYSWMQSQLGQGVTPFNLSAVLPSSGQTTAPGTLTAPNNQILQQLMAMFTGAPSTIPGASGLTQMAQTGDPVDQTAAWQASVAAMQQNIQENAANLKEQFAFGGNLQSSPFGSAMQDYYTQSALQQNALLAQMQSQSLENAASRELSAQQGLTSEASSVGQYLQGLDQASITNLYNEFIRTQPQYNPVLQMLYGSALASPGVVNDTQGSDLGGIASLIGAGSSAALSGADIAGLAAMGL